LNAKASSAKENDSDSAMSKKINSICI
jgi:hypothetical protein